MYILNFQDLKSSDYDIGDYILYDSTFYKVQHFDIKLIGLIDNNCKNWVYSRPYLKSEEYRGISSNSLKDIDFSLNSNLIYQFSCKGSTAFRELICTMTKTVWSATTRVNPVETSIPSTDFYKARHLEDYYRLKSRINFELPQDQRRGGLPYSNYTTFTFTINHRELMLLLNTFKEYDSTLYSMIMNFMEREIQLSESNLLPYKNLLNKVRVDRHSPRISTSCGDMFIMKTQLPYGLISHLIRHQGTVVYDIWDRSYDELSTSLPMETISEVELYVRNADYWAMVSSRMGWLADWVLWDDFIKDATQQLSDIDFYNMIPGFEGQLQDNLGRIDGRDPNIPDIRLIEWPELIHKLPDTYIRNRWIRSVVPKIRDNKDNEYRLQYNKTLENKIRL